MITRVTITGADESIQPNDLIKLSEKFPFVEWGILYSAKRGRPRFPSDDWINKLADVPVALSLHLCGQPVRNFIKDGLGPQDWTDEMWALFQRVQLNFHAIPHSASERMIDGFKVNPTKEFIFQFDDVNNHLIESAIKEGCNVSSLFDKSGGAGILPNKWPALKNWPCGYAGGLGPENLKEQIEIIENIVGDTSIWIDMETRVRSNQDQLFDLHKVYTCLEIAKPYIK